MKVISSAVDTEDLRRALIRVAAHGCWWGAFVLTILRTMDIVGSSWGIPIVFLIGVGIASGLSLSRMHLAETIVQAFTAGLRSATVLQANVTAAAAVIETDDDGLITHVEHSEVIHWKRDALIGRPLHAIIPDRHLRAHHEAFERFRTTTDFQIAGEATEILDEDGKERPVRLAMARLGGALVATLVPQ